MGLLVSRLHVQVGLLSFSCYHIYRTTYIYLHCTSDDDVKATTEGDKLVYNKYVSSN